MDIAEQDSGEQIRVALPEMQALWQETVGWQPQPLQQEQFQHLYELVVAANRQLNLTRITEPTDFWEKHLWDSLRALKPWLMSPEPLTLIDIGTGAGFPGLPVAIARTDWRFTLLDSTRKKIAFINTALETLALPQVTTAVERAEAAGRHPSYRDRYDIALVRAVASAAVCAEYALPFLQVGGTAVLYRGQWTEEEAIALRSALSLLGGVLESVESFVTPLSQGMRHCLYIKKERPTPVEFPRPVGIALQKPLLSPEPSTQPAAPKPLAPPEETAPEQLAPEQPVLEQVVPEPSAPEKLNAGL